MSLKTKKLIIILTLALSPVSVFALPSTLPLQIIQDATEIINGVTQEVIAVTTEITKYATVAMKIKQFVDNPMMALFGVNTGKQIEKEMRKWLATGLQGDPLLIRNPEAYLKNVQTNALRQQIAIIDGVKNKSPWSEGLIVSLIKQRRAEVNPGSPLPKDPTATIVQDSLCKDNGAGLQQMLEQGGPIELGLEGGNEFDQKYNEYCTGDPSTDPDLQKNLIAISTSKDYFSWDSWLSMTSGNNPYVLSTKTQMEIQRRVEEQKVLAEKESASGYLSDKKCVERLTWDEEGGVAYADGEGPCIAYETNKPSATVAGIANQLDANTLLKPLFVAAQDKSLAKDALDGLGDVFKGIQEAVAAAQEVGSQIGQTIQSVQDLRASVNTLTGTLSYAGSALGGGKNPNTSQINLLGTSRSSYNSSATTYAGYNRSTVSYTSQISDGSTPDQLEDVVKPLRDLLTNHQSTMSKVPALVSRINVVINQYQDVAGGITSCVQNIRSNPDFTGKYDPSTLTSIESRLADKRTAVLNPVLVPFDAIKGKIAGTNSYITQTLSTVNTSKNVSAITTLFQDYKQAMDLETILPSDIDSRLELFLKKNSLDLQNDMNGIRDEVNGPSSIKSISIQCATLQSQLESQRGYNTGGNN